MKLMKSATVSWKTTSAAIGALMTVWGPAVTMLTDGNPDTNPDWNVVIAATFAAVGLLLSRDADTTSEQHGK